MRFSEALLQRTVRGTHEQLFAYDTSSTQYYNNENEQEDNTITDNPLAVGCEGLNGENCEPAAGSIGESVLEFLNPNNRTMLVVEQKGLQTIPLDGLLSQMLLALSVCFIVIGGAIPYVFQYAEIYRRKSAVGFSLLVCLALCVANILRIEFWFGKQFETPLLVQSIVMLLVMVAMLEISVRMNKRLIPVTQRTSVWNGDFVEAFWKWNDLSSFLAALLLFTALVSLLNGIFYENTLFVEALGMSALLVEACLGVPQLVRNFQRKSTIGMSVKMVLMWLIGDVGKTIYFVVRESPAQFWICSCLQITIDVLILLQVWLYGHRTPETHGSRIPSYVSSSTSKI